MIWIMNSDALRQELLQSIGSTLAADRSLIALEIMKIPGSIEFLMDLLFEDPPVSTRFSWLLGDISSKDVNYCRFILHFFKNNYDKIKVKDKDRVIAKQAMLCEEELDEEVEAWLMNKLLACFANPQGAKSLESYSLKYLEKLAIKYPELMNELHHIAEMKKERNPFFGI